MNKHRWRPKGPAKTAGRTSSKHAVWLGSVILGVIVLAVALLRRDSSSRADKPASTHNASNAVALSVPASSALATLPVPAERLVGRWMRPDGGYVIEIRTAEPNGRLNATYFNPNPIHVARAEWKHEGTELKLFIELRDVNYPGSTYSLAMQPDAMRLAGTYFQAALGQTFDVAFVRMP